MKYIFLLFLAFSGSVLAQPTFQRSYDFCGNGDGVSIAETDSGYFIFGTSPWDGCYHFFEIDSVGEILNSKEFSLGTDSIITSYDEALLRDNKDFLIFGRIIDSIFWDPYLIKIDGETLDTLWTKRYRKYEQERPMSIKKYKDGYLLLAETHTPIFTSPTSVFWEEVEMLFIQTDENGIELRRVVIQDTFSYSYLGNFDILENGDIAVVHDSSNEFLDQSPYLTILDSNFQIKKRVHIQEREMRGRPNLILSKDKKNIYVNYRFVDWFEGDGLQSSARTYAFDLDLNELWHKDYYGSGYTLNYGSIAKDGDVLLCGKDERGQANGNHHRGRIIRLTRDGEVVWDRMLDIPNNWINNSGLQHIIETKDGSILTVGYMDDRNFESDVYVVKLNADGCLKPTCDSIIFPNPYFVPPTSDVVDLDSSDISVYPNPATNKVTFSFENTNIKSGYVDIFNPFGQLVFQKRITGKKETIALSDWASGIYFYRVHLSGMVMKTGKLMVDQ